MVKRLHLGIFIILVAIFFRNVFAGKLPVPSDTLIGLYHPWLDQAAITNPAGVPFKNFLITDPIRQQIPWRKLVIDSFQSGKLPSWNPYNFSGMPLAANIQAGAFYPLNLLFFFVPFPWAWTALIILQPLLAGLFMYLYLRSKKVHEGVAIVGSLTWGFSGFSVAWLTWGTIVQTALWLPLMLLAMDRGRGVLLVVASVFAFFAGHAQVALYIFLFAALYGLRKNFKWFAIAVIVTSVQWLPIFRELLHSSRIGDAAVWLKDGWFLPWQHLIQFVAPDFFGNPATLNYWGVWNYGEFIGYIGILPLMLALYALIFRRDRLTRFFWIALGVAFLFLLPTPIAKLPYQLKIPLLSTLQPTRLMVLVDVSLAILAALGLDAYIKKPNKKIFFGIVFVGIVIAGLWIYVLRSPMTENLLVSKRNLVLPSVLWAGSSIVLLIFLFIRKWIYVLPILAIGIVSFDLFRFGWKFTPFTPVSYFFPTTKAVLFLQSQSKPFRVMSLDNRIMPPNVNAYFGIESIEGYDPVYDSRYEEFIAALNRKEPNIAPPFGFNRIITSPTIDSPLLPILNVKYILTLEDLRRDDVELVYREGNTRIYWYNKALPRIYPVETIVQARSKQEVIQVLYDPSFRAATTAVVEQPVDMLSTPMGIEEGIEILAYDSSRIRVGTRFLNNRFVVIANMYDPGWRATIDGKPTPIYRTNYVFQGVVVSGGNHTLELSYR